MSAQTQTPKELAAAIDAKEKSSMLYAAQRNSGGGIPIPLTSPEQDCNSAIPVCQNIYSTTASYSGFGATQEIPGNSCLGSNELNSVWYTFTSSTAGNIAFNITPNVLSQDYDFALYNITGTNCSAINSGALTPIRCNFSATGGVTGLSASGTNPSEPASGPNQSTVLATTVGQTYVLIISNYSSSSNGYQLNFTPGTASIFDITPPSLTSVSAPCGSNVLTLNTSEQVTCASIASNGTDISISGTGGPYTITGASGVNCGSSTAQITFTITPALTGGGPWVLNAHSGSDGNSFIDNCGNAMPTTTISFNVSPAVPVITGPTTVCKGSTFALSSSSAVSYTWTGAAVPAGQQNLQTISVTANSAGTLNFQLVVSYGACGTATVNKSVTVTDAPIANFTALPSLTVCAGTVVTFTNTSTYPCSTGGLGLNQCTCGTFLCNATSNQGTFATYLWTFGDGGTAFYIGGSPAANFSPTHTYASAGTYNVSLTASGLINTCSNSKNLTITVLPATPNLTISPSVTICPAQSTTLTVSGGSSYTWTPGATLTSTSNSVTLASPVTTTIYSVSAPGCSGNQTATVQVTLGGTPPVIGAINGSTLVCPNSVGVTYSVANVASTNYTWSVPAGASITSAPTNSNAITVNFGASAGTISVTAVGTCGTATASINVGLSPSLNLTVTPNNSSICAGGSQTLTVSGATSYTWANAATLSSSSGASVIASPITATTYTVIGATGTCTGSATASITMASALTLTLTSNTPTICPGGSALLNAAGATSYTWSNAATLTSPFGAGVTATPLSSSIYTVVGITGGCTGTGTITVGIGACVSSSCNLSLIRSTLTNAGNIELLGMNNACSLYFINPQFMSGPAAQAYAQSFGANLISVQSAAENADVLTALTNQGFAGQVIWIGFSDALLEGSFVWYDGAPITYSNWAPGEPNNAGGNENCTQIYPNGSWNDLNCNGYNSLSVIEVNICPQITVVNPPIHCPNTNVVLTASTLLGSPSYTYTWIQSGTETFTNTSTAGNTDVITVTSTAPNTFTVYSEDRYSCPVSAIASLAVNPTPTITANSATICLGQQTATLTANGATTYSWIPGTGLSATTGAVVTGTPSSTQSYTVIGMDGNGCLNGTITAISVNLTPTVTVNSATLCSGQQTATLIAAGAANYTWTPSTTLNSATGFSVIASPTVTTNYTVTGNNGCSGSAVSSVIVNPIPNIYIIQKNSLCDTSILNWLNVTSVTPGLAQGNLPSGVTFNATHSGSGLSTTPSMFSGATFPVSYSVPIAATTIRNDLAGTFNFCFSQPVINPQIAFASIGQAALPVTITTGVPYQVLWSGINMTYVNSTTLIGAEGFTIIRFPGIHNCISFDYNNNETYINLAFGVMDFVCQGQPICPGIPLDIIANGASTYTWNSGANTTTITPAPLVTTSYSVIGTNSDGCIGTATTNVVVNPSPTITVNSSTICSGQQTATLTANGAITYTWSSGLSALTGTTVTGNPVSTENYTITGTDVNGCINDATTSITVNPTPTVTVNSSSICIGQQTATLTAIGASTYSWSPGIGLSSTTASIVTGTPSTTQDYIITGTDMNGCFDVTTTTITVNSLPILSTTNNSLCAGNSASISVSGANSYTWIPSNTLSSANNASVSASPTVTTTYTVIGVDINTCIDTATSLIDVFPIPTLTITPSYSICSGTSGTIAVSGASTYTWGASASLNSTINDTVTATPNTIETYTVTGEINTCTITAVATISVIVTPTLTINTSSTIICPAGSASLTTNGATNYTWSPIATLSASSGSLVIASPANTSTYNVTGANSTCTSTNQIVVTVTVSPVITSASATICSTASTNLSANGGVTYTWSPATNLNTTSGSNVISTPPSSINYIVSGSSSLGCVGSTSLSVIVIATPTISITGNPLTICSGSTSVLTASGALAYTWSPSSVSAINSAITIASPLNTTIYTATGTNGTAPTICTSTKTIEIVVLPRIIPIISPNDAICFGQTTIIYAKGGNTYHWNPTIGVTKPNDSTTVVKPTVPTIYTVTVSNSNLCPVTATVLIDVNPLPIVNAGRDTTINIDESYVLNGTGNVPVGFLSPDATPLICNWCPIVEVHPIESTCYTLEGFSSFGCRNTDEVCITITKFWDLFIPNAFTPNGDISNEYFMPKGYGLAQINLSIFDRWGVEIFHEDNTELGWDGKYKGVLSQQGVYVYIVDIISLGGENYRKTGHLTMLTKSK